MQTPRQPTPTAPNGTVQFVWNRTFGGTGDDVARSVVGAHGDGVLATGTVNGSVWVVHVDSSGETKWQRTYGDGHGVAIIRDGTGYVVVAGTTPGVRVSKITRSGETRWSYEVAEMGRPTSIVRTAEGEYVISGFLHSDGWLLKTDRSGATEWSRTFGGQADDIFHTLTSSGDGGVVAAGYSNSGGPSQAPWVLKVDRTGTKEWERLLGIEHDETGGWVESIVRADAGGYALTGYRAAGNGVALWKLGTDGQVEWNRTYVRGSGEALLEQERGYAIAGFQTAEVAFLTTDDSGTFRAFRKFGYEGFGHGYSIASTNDDEYVIVGRYNDPRDSGSSYDALILKLEETS